MTKAKFISNHKKINCWRCEGTGKLLNDKCPLCKGTGIWIEKHWYLVYTNKKGQKIAFGVDSIK